MSGSFITRNSRNVRNVSHRQRINSLLATTSQESINRINHEPMTTENADVHIVPDGAKDVHQISYM